ncbi:MAG: LysR family transcriptional regulator [Kutzneria sp.]|nr:LysR family transcriptional regulator [Kutzneria sp.]
MDVHLRDLRYFVAVAEELSFTAAASRLHVAQPTLSKQIRQLETTLRAQLFARDRRQVVLTEVGAVLVPWARRLVADWERARTEVADAVAAGSKTLRIGALTSIGRELYPRVAKAFAESEPQWRLNLEAHSWDDVTAGLADGGVDVAIVWLPVPDPDIGYHVLFTEPRWVALPPCHRLADRNEVNFAELLDEPFIALPAEAGELREFWLATEERAGHPVRIGREVVSTDAAFEAVASGAGVCLLAEGNVAIYRRPDIVCRPVAGVSPCQLAVAWRRGDNRSVVRAFVAACRQAAANPPSDSQR